MSFLLLLMWVKRVKNPVSGIFVQEDFSFSGRQNQNCTIVMQRDLLWALKKNSHTSNKHTKVHSNNFEFFLLPSWECSEIPRKTKFYVRKLIESGWIRPLERVYFRCLAVISTISVQNWAKFRREHNWSKTIQKLEFKRWKTETLTFREYVKTPIHQFTHLKLCLLESFSIFDQAD